MTIRAKQDSASGRSLDSWFRIEPGHSCDLTFHLEDTSGHEVRWAGHEPRFRVYSQYIDQAVVLEVTDPSRCVFEDFGTWRLQLTPDETESLPRGGMRFTLEHRDSGGEYELGLFGSVSCRKGQSMGKANQLASLTSN